MGGGAARDSAVREAAEADDMGRKFGGGQLASLQSALNIIRKIQTEGGLEAKIVTEIPAGTPCHISRSTKNTEKGRQTDPRVLAALRRLCLFLAPQFTKSGK